MRHIRVLIIALLCLAPLITSVVAQENYSTWSHSQNVYLNSGSMGAMTANPVYKFPVLIRLRPDNFLGFAQAMAPVGQDFRFSKKDGTPLPYYIERYVDVTGFDDTADIWVLTDTIYNNNAMQHIVMHWGKAGAADSSNSAKVFDTANGYEGVWNFNGGFNDLTANRNNGYPMGAPTMVPGINGTGIDLNGTNQKIMIPDTPSIQMSGKALTLSAWVYARNPLSGNSRTILMKGNSTPFYVFGFNSTYLTFQSQNMPSVGWSSPFPENSWHYVTAIVDSFFTTLYVDGMWSNNISNVGGNLNNTGPDSLYIGGTFNAAAGENFNGLLDDVRIERKTRTADWVKLSFENQKPNQKLVDFHVRRWIRSSGVGSWNDSANWMPAKVPFMEDSVIFDIGGSSVCTLSNAVSVRSLVFTNGFTGVFNYNNFNITVTQVLDMRTSGQFNFNQYSKIYFNQGPPALKNKDFYLPQNCAVPAQNGLIPEVYKYGMDTVMVHGDSLHCKKIYMSDGGLNLGSIDTKVDTIIEVFGGSKLNASACNLTIGGPLSVSAAAKFLAPSAGKQLQLKHDLYLADSTSFVHNNGIVRFAAGESHWYNPFKSVFNNVVVEGGNRTATFWSGMTVLGTFTCTTAVCTLKFQESQTQYWANANLKGSVAGSVYVQSTGTSSVFDWNLAAQTDTFEYVDLLKVNAGPSAQRPVFNLSTCKDSAQNYNIRWYAPQVKFVGISASTVDTLRDLNTVIKWRPVVGATKYYIAIYDTIFASWGVVKDSINAPDTSYTLPKKFWDNRLYRFDITTNFDYDYFVGNSFWLQDTLNRTRALAYMNVPAPQIVYPQMHDTSHSSSMAVRWHPVPGATAYKISAVDTFYGTWSRVNATTADTFFTLMDMYEGRAYRIQVASNLDADSFYTDGRIASTDMYNVSQNVVHVSIPAAVPVYPMNGDTVKSANLKFQWQSAPGATKYYIVIHDSTATGWGSVIDSTTDTFFNVNAVKGIGDDIPYYWEIATNLDFSSADSYSVNTTNPGTKFHSGFSVNIPTPSLNYPAQFDIISRNNLIADWPSVPGAAKYYVSLYDSSTHVFVKKDSTTGISYQFNNLIDNRDYLVSLASNLDFKQFNLKSVTSHSGANISARFFSVHIPAPSFYVSTMNDTVRKNTVQAYMSNTSNLVSGDSIYFHLDSLGKNSWSHIRTVPYSASNCSLSIPLKEGRYVIKMSTSLDSFGLMSSANAALDTFQFDIPRPTITLTSDTFYSKDAITVRWQHIMSGVLGPQDSIFVWADTVTSTAFTLKTQGPYYVDTSFFAVPNPGVYCIKVSTSLDKFGSIDPKNIAVDTIFVRDTIPPPPVGGFHASWVTKDTAKFSWTPSPSLDADSVIIRYQIGSYPTSPADAFLASRRLNARGLDSATGFASSTVYKVCAFVKDAFGNWSTAAYDTMRIGDYLAPTTPLTITFSNSGDTLIQCRVQPDTANLRDMYAIKVAFLNSKIAPVDSVVFVLSPKDTSVTMATTKYGNWYSRVQMIDTVGNGSAYRYDSVTVANIAPKIVAIRDTSILEDVPFMALFNVSDFNGEAVTRTLESVPSGMAIQSVTMLHFTPLNANVGTHQVVLKATDAGGAFSRDTFMVTVVNVNDAPVLTYKGPDSIGENQPFAGEFTKTDQDMGDTLTYQPIVLPAWLAIRNDSLVGVTPIISSLRTDSIIIAVYDRSGLSDTIFTKVTILANAAPMVVIPKTLTNLGDTAISCRIQPDMNNLQDIQSIAIAFFRPGNSITDSLLYIVTPRDTTVYAKTVPYGTWKVRVFVRDSSGNVSLPQMDSIFVQNKAPVFVAVSDTSVPENSSFTRMFTVTDYNGETLTREVVTAPVGMGIVTLGTLSWTPLRADLGAHAIVLKATDGGGAVAYDTFTLTVTRVNSAPLFVSGTIPDTLYEKRADTVTISVTDTDANDSVYIVNLAPKSWISCGGMTQLGTTGIWTGKIRFAPQQADTGKCKVTFAIRDRVGEQTLYSDSFFVADVNDGPSTMITTVSTSGGALRIAFSGRDDRTSALQYDVAAQRISDGYSVFRDTLLVDTLSLFPLIDGTYRIKVRAIDGAGIIDTNTAMRDVTIAAASSHVFADTGAWSMVGVPGKGVTGDSLKGAGYISTWDESSVKRNVYGFYRQTADISTIDPGKGYWRKAHKASSIVLSSQQLIDTTVVINLAKSDSGWNQISNPYVYPVRWPNAHQTLWAYNPVTRDYVADSTGKNVMPWTAYWVKTSVASSVALERVPVFGTGFAKRLSSVAYTSARDWRIRMSMIGTGVHDAENVFGCSPGARDGFDSLDKEEPPRLEGERSLYLQPFNSGGMFAWDIRKSLSEDRPFSFVMTPGAQARISFEGVADLDELGLYWATPDTCFQITTASVVTIPASEKTTFAAVFASTNQQFARRFPRNFAVAGPFPNPCRPSTNIVYTLPYQWGESGLISNKNYLVTINIIDVRGRIVASLVNREQRAGTYRVLWQGKSATGRFVAAGQYYVNVRAGSFKHTMPISVTR